MNNKNKVQYTSTGFSVRCVQPLNRLCRQRPLSNVFNVYMLATVVLQFALHFATLLTLVDEAHRLQAVLNATTNASAASDASSALASATNVSVLAGAVGSNASSVNATNNSTAGAKLFFESKPFQPNLVNTVVYLLGVLLQLITFTVNYKVTISEQIKIRFNLFLTGPYNWLHVFALVYALKF